MLLHNIVRWFKKERRSIFNETLHDSHEGGRAVTVEGQANKAAKIPTNLNDGEGASNFQALGFCVEMAMTRLRRTVLLHHPIPVTRSASTWSGTVFLWMHKDFVELLM